MFRTYEGSLNPPILHRKEFAFHRQGHPGREEIKAELTRTAEGLGLFDETLTIGFQLNWEQLIKSKGYESWSATLLPTEAAVGDDANACKTFGEPVRSPLDCFGAIELVSTGQLLLRVELLGPGTSFF